MNKAPAWSKITYHILQNCANDQFYFGIFYNILASFSGHTAVFMFLQEDFLFLACLFTVHLNLSDTNFVDKIRHGRNMSQISSPYGANQ